jgi:hypothetical protein
VILVHPKAGGQAGSFGSSIAQLSSVMSVSGSFERDSADEAEEISAAIVKKFPKGTG